MSVLQELVSAIKSASVEIIDLTAPLESTTPVIQLPEPFANTRSFTLTEVSRYDERGPAWYWNDISTGEHTGTHFDAPVHWISGRDGLDVSQVPAASLVAPAVVLDFSAEAAADPASVAAADLIRARAWECLVLSTVAALAEATADLIRFGSRRLGCAVPLPSVLIAPCYQLSCANARLP